jgi:hypothetical protein
MFFRNILYFFKRFIIYAKISHILCSHRYYYTTYYNVLISTYTFIFNVSCTMKIHSTNTYEFLLEYFFREIIN